MSKRAAVTNIEHLQCHICGKQFRRQEHLLRHRTIHSNERPYNCLQCSKRFSRRDTLERHVLVHKQNLEAGGRRDVTRACQPCASSRIRCSRGLPCSQCTSKNRNCAYKDSKQSGESVVDGILDTDEVVSTLPEEANIPQDNVADPSSHIDSHQQTTHSSRDAQDESAQTFDTQLTGEGVEGFHPDPSAPESYANVDSLGLNWWSPEQPQTENWILNQALLSDWHTQAFGSTTEAVQSQDCQLSHDPSAADLITASVVHINQEYASASAATQYAPSPFAETLVDIAGSLKSDPSERPGVSGRFYAEGTAGRLAFGGQGRTLLSPKRRVQSETALHGESSGSSAQTTTTSACASTNLSEVQEDIFHLTGRLYMEVVIGIQQTLLLQSLAEGDNLFPSPTLISSFLKTYFDNFHPIYPFLHPHRISSSGSPWLVILAMSAVGAHIERSRHGLYLHGLLAKALQVICADSDLLSHIQGSHRSGPSSTDTRVDGLSVLQASILNTMLLISSGDATLTSRALITRAHLVECCEHEGLLNSGKDSINRLITDYRSIQDWIVTQTRLRTGLMIWLLDTILANMTDGTYRLPGLTDSVHLPSPERYWDDPMLVGEDDAYNNSKSIPHALETIWIDKQLPKNLSHFGYVLLIHAIQRKVSEVTSQSQTRLCAFVPSLHLQHTVSVPATFTHNNNAGDTWRAWRNSACDSLDVLHWAMNGQIAEHGGLESPPVFFLHLSRLLLLSPVSDLQKLADDPLLSRRAPNRSSNITKDDLSVSRARVIRWALQDKYKARLCVVHAGALFWHVRRYGTPNFVQPFAIYLATLVLWSYATVVQISSGLRPIGIAETRDQQEHHQQIFGNGQQLDPVGHNEASSALETPFIYLDRPCDDEMVQNFVREGHLMTAYINDVGDISQSDAPRRILHVGTQLLTGKNRAAPTAEDTPGPIWGVQRHYADSLRRCEST